jgi:outer membrane protein assembly factor BamB
MANRVAVLCIVAALGCGKSPQPTSDPSDVVSDPGAGNMAPAPSSGTGGIAMVQAGRSGAGVVAAVSGTGGATVGIPAQVGGAGSNTTEQPPKPDTTILRGAWPTFGGDLGHTRSQATETTISAQNVAMLKPAFDISAPSVTATPAIYGGVVYWADWAGFVHATQLDKTELWKVDRSAMVGGYTGSPPVTETLVYVANRNGLVSAFDRMTGNAVWEVKLDAGPHTHIWSSPVVAEQDGVLVIGVGGAGTRDNGDALPQTQLQSFHGRIEGLDSASGKSLWKVEVSPAPMNGAGVSVWSSAALDTERKLAFIGTGNNYYRPVSPYSDSFVSDRLYDWQDRREQTVHDERCLDIRDTRVRRRRW